MGNKGGGFRTSAFVYLHFTSQGAYMSTENGKEPFWAKIILAVIQGVVNAVVLFVCLKIFGVI